MKLRKTPKSERTTYTYYFDNGDKIILEPGKATTIRSSGYVLVQVDDSITELTIAQMHKDDDKEIELKNNKSENMLNIFRKKTEKLPNNTYEES